MGGPPSNAHRNDWTRELELQRTTRTALSTSLAHTNDNAAVKNILSGCQSIFLKEVFAVTYIEQ